MNWRAEAAPCYLLVIFVSAPRCAACRQVAEQASACVSMAPWSGRQPVSVQMRLNCMFLTPLQKSCIWNLLA